jgi:multisubunit Na+/H+ antiporter MnhB subunit
VELHRSVHVTRKEPGAAGPSGGLALAALAVVAAGVVLFGIWVRSGTDCSPNCSASSTAVALALFYGVPVALIALIFAAVRRRRRR